MREGCAATAALAWHACAGRLRRAVGPGHHKNRASRGQEGRAAGQGREGAGMAEGREGTGAARTDHALLHAVDVVLVPLVLEQHAQLGGRIVEVVQRLEQGHLRAVVRAGRCVTPRACNSPAAVTHTHPTQLGPPVRCTQAGKQSKR